jgi:hypothetical protein
LRYQVAQIRDSVAIDDEEKVVVPRALIEAAIRERVEGSLGSRAPHSSGDKER